MNPTEKALYAVAHAADARTENAPTPSSKARAHGQAYDAQEAIAAYHHKEAAEATARANKAHDMAAAHLYHANA